MFKTKTPSSYEALSSRDEESPLTLTERSRAEVDVVRVTVTRTPLWVKLCLFLSWLFIAIQVGFDFRLLSNNNGDARVEANRPNLDFPLPTGLLYSPAQHVLVPEIKRFHFGFAKDKSEYQGEPSDELDAKWKKLYHNLSFLRLNKDEAERIPNKTVPFPGDPGYYAVGLAVFHQLHCLNSIRIGLNAPYYKTKFPPFKFDPVHGPYGTQHLDHCLDLLRESIMCASDVSVLVFKWNEKRKETQPHGDVLHQCRNFDRVWQWGWENKAVVEFDFKKFVENDLVMKQTGVSRSS